MAMKRRLYAEAAKYMEEEGTHFCCLALIHVGLPCEEFEAWFKEDAVDAEGGIPSFHAAYMSNAFWSLPYEERETAGYDSFTFNHNARILALCFMAALTDAERKEVYAPADNAVN